MGDETKNEEKAAPPPTAIVPTSEQANPAPPPLVQFAQAMVESDANTPMAKAMVAIVQAWGTNMKWRPVYELAREAMRYAFIGGVVAGGVWLAHDGKLDTTAASLISLTLGYLFGRKSHED